MALQYPLLDHKLNRLCKYYKQYFGCTVFWRFGKLTRPNNAKEKIAQKLNTIKHLIMQERQCMRFKIIIQMLCFLFLETGSVSDQDLRKAMEKARTKITCVQLFFPGWRK